MENTFNIENNNVTVQPKWGLIISILVVSLLVFLRDLGIMAIPPAIFILVITVISVSLPYKSLRSFSFFYIIGGSGIHGIAYIPLLIALFYKSKSINIHQIGFALLVLVFEFVHIAFGSFAIDFNRYIIFGLNILFFFFLLFDNKINNKDVRDDIKFYIIGTAFALFIVVLHSVILYGVADTLLGYKRLGALEAEEIEGDMATTFNANYMAYYAVVAFALALFVKGIFRKAWFKALMMFVVVLAGVMTASRSWLLVMAFIMIVYFLFSRVRNKIALLFVVFVVFVVAQRYTSISSAFYGRFAQRIEGQDISEAGMRLSLFKQYNEFLVQHPERMIYGTGALNYKIICAIPYSVHNGTQQIVVCYGLLGVLILFWIGIKFYDLFIKKRKTPFWDYVPFIACVLFVQSIQLVSPVSLILPFAAAILPLKLDKEEI